MPTKASRQTKWLEDAVFYEIYPQSWFDTNADGSGNLPGVSGFAYKIA